MNRAYIAAEDNDLQMTKVEDCRIEYPHDDSIHRYVDLLSDVGFKLVFGKESNKDILIEFLNNVIPEHRILDLKYIDKEKVGYREDDKCCVFDVYCLTDSGGRIIVEVQKKIHDWYVERMLYYSSFPIQDQMESGDKEYRLCPVYVISILQTRLECLDTGDSVRSSFRLYEDRTGVLLTDRYNIILIELGKFHKSLEELDGSVMDGFYYCLKNMSNLQDRPIELQQKIFARIFEASRVARMTKVEQHKYRNTMMTKRDIWCYGATERRHGMEQGMEQGIEQGKQQTSLSIAKNLLSLGISSDIIAKATGLAPDQIHD